MQEVADESDHPLMADHGALGALRGGPHARVPLRERAVGGLGGEALQLREKGVVAAASRSPRGRRCGAFGSGLARSTRAIASCSASRTLPSRSRSSARCSSTGASFDPLFDSSSAAASRTAADGASSWSCASTGIATRRISLLTSTSLSGRGAGFDHLAGQRSLDIAGLSVPDVGVPVGADAQAVVAQGLERRDGPGIVEDAQRPHVLDDLFVGGAGQSIDRVLQRPGLRARGGEEGRGGGADQRRHGPPVEHESPSSHWAAATTPEAPYLGAVQLPHAHG